MSAKVEGQVSRGDTAKLVLAAALVLAGVVGFHYFDEQASLLLRVVGLLAVVLVALALGLRTDPGRRAWLFAQEARTELRKVVWPTRQETMQTTLLVMGMVLVVAVILWLLDMFLAWGVRLLVHRGAA
ncbi:preprotein translocase subunit SecE [Inmirania thermothiophila]|uniref:Protein translocase subunit SecE n=1 Tax=Inmirania thermothiophila TaxID=1750597 RepID=A0A3N1Y8E6_9GAMM|nr:preprotein translocase subunit SecE [Inmirania thermothiophila]ROR34811.1 protein translocase subunit secE/sec61 gamma [Inmirania thermothiophila]